MITTTTRQHALRDHLPGQHPRVASTVEQHARLAARLTARDTWLLALLHEHRVLTTTQIQRAAFPSGRAARQRLRELCLWRAVSRFQPFRQRGSAPMHYVLGPAGAAVLAATHGLEVAELGYRHDRAMAIAHNQRLAHTLGVNDFFTTLIATGHHRPVRGALTVWWSEARCARHFGDLVIPDGYGRWHPHHHDRAHDTTCDTEWFLEFDTGTESLTKVGRKLAAYARLAESTGIATPVLFWLPSSRRETGARRALARVHADLDHPATVPVATATPDHLDTTGQPSPADAVWLPLTTARAARPDRTSGPRYTLTDLPRAWPHLDTPTAPVHDDSPDDAPVTAGPYRLPPATPIPPAATPNRLGHTAPPH